MLSQCSQYLGELVDAVEPPGLPARVSLRAVAGAGTRDPGGGTRLRGAPKTPQTPPGNPQRTGLGSPEGEGVSVPPVPDRQVLQLHRVVHEIPWVGGTG